MSRAVQGISPRNNSDLRFCDLRDILIGRLRQLLEHGNISESYLARRLGISQPHLHNTLKGVRTITIQTADQFLDRLGWTALELCAPEDLETALKEVRSHRVKRGQMMPVLDLFQFVGNVVNPQPIRQISTPREWLAVIVSPSVCAITKEIDTGGVAARGDLILVERQISCLPPGDAAYVVLLEDSKCALRWINRGARTYYQLELSGKASSPGRWTPIHPNAIMGRIHAISQPRSGTFLPPVPPSVSS